MTTALTAVLQDAGALSTVDDKSFKDLSGSGSFLPRLQLCGGNSKICKTGKIGIGRWGLMKGKDEVVDLTTEVDVIVCAMRARATDTSKEGEVLNSFEQNSEQFKAIAAMSDIHDSGCMFGPEFLIYIPSASQFATYFMSSKTARNKATAMRDALGKGATLGVEFIETKKYSWHGPTVKPCSSPLTEPSAEEAMPVVKTFLNPPKVETVKDDGRDR